MNRQMRRLTGRIHYRRGLFGKIVLQVQLKCPAHLPGDWYCKWVDADEQDMAELGSILKIDKGDGK